MYVKSLITIDDMNIYKGQIYKVISLGNIYVQHTIDYYIVSVTVPKRAMLYVDEVVKYTFRKEKIKRICGLNV